MTTEFDPAGPDEAQAMAQGDVERLGAELEAARAKAQENWDNYLRAVAETDNLRKRAARDVESASRYAIERFAAELLEVRDSLELGVAAGAAADPAPLLEGMEATLRLLNKAFEKSGIVVLDPLGKAVQSRIPRGHGHAADRRPGGGYRTGGGAEGLPAERQAAAPGPGRDRAADRPAGSGFLT